MMVDIIRSVKSGVGPERSGKPETFMRLTKERTEENRRRVVDEAARLFRERGFDGIGVADLMQAAGFTHGGFYNHFTSKTELAALALRQTLCASAEKLDRAGADPTRAHDEIFADYVTAYLSIGTRDQPGKSCAIAALATDVSRQEKSIREAFSQGLQTYLASFAKVLPQHPKDRDEIGATTCAEARRAGALAAIASLVGGLVLARAVAGADDAFSQEILDSIRDHLLDQAHSTCSED